MTASLAIRFGPAPFRQAILTAAVAAGLDVIAPSDDAIPGHCAVLVYVDDEDRWDELAKRAVSNPAVAVLPELSIEMYTRALALGAGAVHVDNSIATILDAVIAATLGEARLPLGVTQALASYSPPTREDLRALGLTAFERTLATAVCDGLTAVEMAVQLGYSERTIRRKLQGLYLKLGASCRAEAIRSLTP